MHLYARSWELFPRGWLRRLFLRHIPTDRLSLLQLRSEHLIGAALDLVLYVAQNRRLTQICLEVLY